MLFLEAYNNIECHVAFSLKTSVSKNAMILLASVSLTWEVDINIVIHYAIVTWHLANYFK